MMLFVLVCFFEGAILVSIARLFYAAIIFLFISISGRRLSLFFISRTQNLDICRPIIFAQKFSIAAFISQYFP